MLPMVSRWQFRRRENERLNMRVNEKAVLVKLSIGLPGNSRKDKRVTSETIIQHHLGEKSGRWMKQLYPDEAMEPLTQLANAARTYHYSVTLPWTDEGMRLLPTLLHQEYTASLRKSRQEFEALSESHFIGRLSEWEAWARAQHNGTFNPDDYIGADKLRKKFAFTTDFSPVPSGGDFRLDIGAEEREIMAQAVDARVASAVQDAQSDLWTRLVNPLSAMVDRLKDPKAIFRDSLISNLAEISKLIPKLNLTCDVGLSAFAAQVQSELAGLQPETLRTDAVARDAARAKAQAILDRMAGYTK